MNWRVIFAMSVGLLIPLVSIAGKNRGGCLIVASNAELAYSQGDSTYCGRSGLTDCSAAVVTVPSDTTAVRVFHILAAFPDTTSPALLGLSFGIDYDPNKLFILGYGWCCDKEWPTGNWPSPGSGDVLVWVTPQTARLVEAYWFAGYGYSPADSSQFSLTAHPTLGGVFADDQAPPAEDTIVAYGKLGFGMVGYRACPGGGEYVQYDGEQSQQDHGAGETPPVETGEVKAVYRETNH